MTEFDIPNDKMIPLVDETTKLFNTPTMDALDLRYPRIVRLTQAEYDALTTEQQEDPTIIYVIPAP